MGKMAPICGNDNVPLRFIWILFSKETTHQNMAQAAEFIQLVKESSVRESFSQLNSAEAFQKTFTKSVDAAVHHEHTRLQVDRTVATEVERSIFCHMFRCVCLKTLGGGKLSSSPFVRMLLSPFFYRTKKCRGLSILLLNVLLILFY